MNDATYQNLISQELEKSFKAGALSIWILAALHDSPKHMAEIRTYIFDTFGAHMVPDDKSLYRALRKFYDAELVDFDMVTGTAGPDRKQYKLTPIGSTAYIQFVDRNIKPFATITINSGASHEPTK